MGGEMCIQEGGHELTLVKAGAEGENTQCKNYEVLASYCKCTRESVCYCIEYEDTSHH